MAFLKHPHRVDRRRLLNPEIPFAYDYLLSSYRYRRFEDSPMYCDALFAENMSANVLVSEEALGVNALEDVGELCELGIELQEVRGAECMRFRPVRLPAVPSNDALVNLEQPAVWHVESIWSISSHSWFQVRKKTRFRSNKD